MTFAITKVQCYGIEAEEALNKRYRQYMVLRITAANTDTDLDLGDNQSGSLGTFWTAAGTGTPGAGALLSIQDIVTRAQYFDGFGGDFMDRAQVDSSMVNLTYIDTGASTGGAAGETLTLTGAATSDIPVAATPIVAASGAITLQQAASAIATADAYPVIFTGDPGSGAKLRVLLQRAGVSTPVAGTYTVSYANTCPDIAFASGDAPTAYTVVLKWILQPQTAPVEYYAEA
jgi:hypothetical protein